eukprot:1433453-Prymnesium_polylepis.1
MQKVLRRAAALFRKCSTNTEGVKIDCFKGELTRGCEVDFLICVAGGGPARVDQLAAPDPHVGRGRGRRWVCRSARADPKNSPRCARRR